MNRTARKTIGTSARTADPGISEVPGQVAESLVAPACRCRQWVRTLSSRV